MKKFPFVLMRGGTSKGVFFHEKDMPADRRGWDEFLLDVMGSPDLTQIDGLGGANSLTSKVAIISSSKDEDTDVNYLFAQVSLDKSKVAWDSNCGNISSAVGPFAVEEGLVAAPSEGLARVRIFNVNSQKRFVSEFEVEDGRPCLDGACAIPGVPGTAAGVWLSFSNPQGALYGKVFPTGNPVDVIPTSRGEIPVSIVDSGAPLVFARREDLGLTGTEMPSDFDAETLAYLEEIRQRGASLCTTGQPVPDANCSPAVPKMTLVGRPVSYESLSGQRMYPDDMDVWIRMMSMQRPHNALAITGAISIATACALKGTLVEKVTGANLDKLRIGHFGGVMEVGIGKNDEGDVECVRVLRTARRIAEGSVYTKREY